MQRIYTLWGLLVFGLCVPPGYLEANEDTQTLYRQGLQAWQRQQPAKAEAAFKRCLALDSTYYDAYVSLAGVYQARHQFQQADTLLAIAMRLKPGRQEAIFAYGQLLDRQGDKKGAYDQLRRVLKLEPDLAAAHMGIGYLRMQPTQMMDLDEAGEAFARVCALEPRSWEAYFNLGKVRLFQGDWEGAMRSFRDLLIHKPNNFSTHYQLGMTSYLREDYEQAVDHLRRAAELNPKSLIVRWALYQGYARLGGYPDDLDAQYRIEFSPEPGLPRSIGVVFAEISAEVGLVRSDVGRSSTWADYDNDGDQDLFAMGHFEGGALFRNDATRFVEQTHTAGVEGPGGFGSIFADYDNDGDQDLYITRDAWYGKAPNTLYRNEGNGTFADVSQTAHVADEGSSFTAIWGDVDGNGYLDLFVSNGVPGDGAPNRLYLGNERGHFADIASRTGIRPDRSIGSAFADYDNDGDLDLYVANFNRLNTFYRNEGNGAFTDVTRQTRTQMPLGGYSAFFFDFDQDGWLDLFCSEMSDYQTALFSMVEGRVKSDKDRSFLYRNSKDGSFQDATYRADLGRSHGSVGAHFGDFDNDGFPDIYLANGGAEITRLEADALLYNRGDGRFVEIGRRVGLEQLGRGYGVSLADWDGDGDQDIYVPIGGTYPGDQHPNKLYRNDSPPRSWITLRLQGTKSNRDGIGARVRLRTAGRTLYAEVRGGGGLGSGNSRQLELGLDAAQKIENLEIRWPSGQIDSYQNLAVNQVLDLVEGTGGS